MTKKNSVTPVPKPKILEANGVRLNLTTRETDCDGIAVGLTPLEFDILEILMRSAGQVLSEHELRRALDNKPVNPFEGGLEGHVIQLKRKLERGRRLISITADNGYLFPAEDELGASGYQLA